MKLTLSIVLICSVSCLLAQTMFRGNAALTGEYKSADVNQIVETAFAFKTSGPVRSSPAVVNGLLYVGSSDGVFYCMDSQTGSERWRFKTGGPITSSPAVDKSVVWFLSRDGYFYALNADSGKELWKFKMGVELVGTEYDQYWDYYLASPVIANGNVYIGGGDGILYAFNSDTKKNLWKYNAGSKIRTAAAKKESLLVFGTTSGNVIGLDPNSGKEKWKFATEGAGRHYEFNDVTSVSCSPALANGVVVFGGRDSFVYGVDATSGTQKWKITHDSSSWILSTAISGNTAFIGSGSALIVQATDLQTGKEKWRFATKGAVFSSIGMTNENIYFSDLNGSVYALDKEKGTKKWEYATGSRVFSTPVIVNNMVYFGSDDGNLYALKGSPTSKQKNGPARKIVYWEGQKTDSALVVFSLNTDLWLRDYFKQYGYELMNATQLKDFITNESGKGPSVIVFSDNKIPSTLSGNFDENCLLRKYLNQGGKTVVFGDNPLSYKIDPNSGVFKGIDVKQSQNVLGIKLIPLNMSRGYYTTMPTDEGRKAGLHDSWISFGAMVANEPAITVLTVNEFGRPSSWIKNFGGPKNSGWLQFNINTFKGMTAERINQLKTVIEQGIEW